MARAHGLIAAVGLGMAVALIPAAPAHACSCAAPDVSAQVQLDISDSEVAPAESPWGGGEGSSAMVDLRGGSVTVVGATPALLEGLALDDVPVLASVLDDPRVADSCGTPHRPEVGSDLEVLGTVMDEGEGVFVFTGPCSGSIDVIAGPDEGEAAPGPSSPPSEPGRGVLGYAVIGGAAVLLLGLVAGGALGLSRRGDAS